MASKYFTGSRTSNDFSRAFINLDTMCQVYSQTQVALNKTPTFKEKKPKDEVKEENENKCECSSCDKSCNDNKSEKDKLFDFRFSGCFSDTIDDDDEDNEYLCEFCTSLGYTKKYRPEICDNCTTCETCAEYEDEECSGCSYSRFRDGSFYRDKLSDKDLFSQNDLDILEDIKLDTKGGERFEREEPFSVNNI